MASFLTLIFHEAARSIMKGDVNKQTSPSTNPRTTFFTLFCNDALMVDQSARLNSCTCVQLQWLAQKLTIDKIPFWLSWCQLPFPDSTISWRLCSFNYVCYVILPTILNFGIKLKSSPIQHRMILYDSIRNREAISHFPRLHVKSSRNNSNPTNSDSWKWDYQAHPSAGNSEIRSS